jgi:hypothetical protein
MRGRKDRSLERDSGVPIYRSAAGARRFLRLDPVASACPLFCFGIGSVRVRCALAMRADVPTRDPIPQRRGGRLLHE